MGKPSSKLAEILISNTPVGYIILDKQYRIHYMNECFMKMRGFTKENTLGRHCYDMSNAGVKCDICAVEGAIKTGMKQKVTRKDILPNGEVRFVEDYAIPIYGKDGISFDYILEIMVNRTSEMLYQEQVDKDFINLIRALMTMLEAKDQYTAMHSRNVGNISKSLAVALGLSTDLIDDIEIAALLHDIGKVNIPYSIINKPGKLSDEEFAIIKRHPGNSFIILQRLSGLMKVKEYARYHHERYDGRGYPDGLQGNEIPLGARIITIADTYDAMTSTRSYRKALSHEVAMEEIKNNAGTQFDPRLVESFLTLSFAHNEDNIIEETKNLNLVERHIVEAQDVIDHTQNKFMMAIDEETVFEKVISDNTFIEEIFINTPVSYILLTPDFDVVYASPLFLDNFHLMEENTIGKKYYELSNGGDKCASCLIEQVIKTNAMSKGDLVQTINGETRYFDCFAMPYHNEDGTLKYVVEILLDRTEEALLRQEHENSMIDMITMLSELLSTNDKGAFNKSKYIRKLSNRVVAKLGLAKEKAQEIDIAATICDIGMISLSDVSMDEEEKLRAHPVVAYNIIKDLSVFKDIADIVRHHQELYNGKGYPDGLAGESIPLGARIISILDAYYDLKQLHGDNGLELLLANTDNAYDPQLLQVLNEVLNAKSRYASFLD